MKVLIADDHDDGRETLTVLLELAGHQVQTAENGALAVEAAKDFNPDIVLMDIEMPVMDGCGATKALKQHPNLRHCAIYAMTAYPFETVLRRCSGIPFSGFLQKPVTDEALVKVFGPRALTS